MNGLVYERMRKLMRINEHLQAALEEAKPDGLAHDAHPLVVEALNSLTPLLVKTGVDLGGTGY